MKEHYQKQLRFALVLIFWLLVWQGIAMIINKEILVPTPIVVLERLGVLISENYFWLAIGTSLFRVALGLIIGTIVGIIIAFLTYKFKTASALLKPVMHFAKATPVASFIILAIIWINVGNVPILTSALIVLPTIWANVEKGLYSIDKSHLELAKAFKMSRPKILSKIVIPSVKPYFLAAMNVAVGMAWKAGIAAEVIAPYKESIGAALYNSKIYLETTDLFAWTLLVVLLSILVEKFILFLIKREGRFHA